jgi:hypothetical protein
VTRVVIGEIKTPSLSSDEAVSLPAVDASSIVESELSIALTLPEESHDAKPKSLSSLQQAVLRVDTPKRLSSLQQAVLKVEQVVTRKATLDSTENESAGIAPSAQSSTVVCPSKTVDQSMDQSEATVNKKRNRRRRGRKNASKVE